MGKGGEQTTKVEIPEEIKKSARENQEFAKQVGALPYSPNFGNQFAAFTPTQNAAFQGTSNAASAFGMPNAGAQTGLPPPTDVGGFKGYSTQPLYEDSMSKVDPKIMELIKSFFYGGANAPQMSGQPPPQQGNGRGVTAQDLHPLASNGRAFK